MTETYRYTVDNEKVTLDEIAARCPLVSRSTISNRVRLGWRTWAELTKAPDKVQQARRKGRGANARSNPARAYNCDLRRVQGYGPLGIRCSMGLQVAQGGSRARVD